MSKARNILIAYSILLVLLHIWGAIAPSHFNWGFHFFAFYNPLLLVLTGGAVFLFFFPKICNKIYDEAGEIFNKINNNFLFFLAVSFIFSIYIFFSLLYTAKLHLLGDGALLLREIAGIELGEPLPHRFNRQSLTWSILQILKSLFFNFGITEPEKIIQIIGLVSGVIFLTINFLLVRLLLVSKTEKFFLSSLLLFGAGSQFFFGYVENYTLLYITIAGFLVTGWYTLERNMHISIPVVLFVIMIGLHVVSIALLPCVIVLIIYKWKHQKIENLFIIGLTILILTVVLLLNIENIAFDIEKFAEGSLWNFLPLWSSDAYFPYSIFSIAHLVDWLNANLLIAPFSLIVVLVILVIFYKLVDFKNPVFIFLSVSTLSGLFFTYVVFFALGMARDWDFISSFFLPLIFLSIYLLSKHHTAIGYKYTLVLVAALSFFHWVSWVGINSDKDKHFARIKLLDSPYFLGHVSRLEYYEAIGSYFWSKQNYNEAKNYFEKYIELDPNNPRLLGNISVIYTKLNETDKSFRVLQKAAQSNTGNPGVYINLGAEYQHRGELEKAIEMYKKALTLDSTRITGFANLGGALMLLKDYKLANFYYMKAIKLGFRNPVLLREAAFSFYYLNDFGNSIKYLDQYLTFHPDDEQIITIRKKITSKLSMKDKDKHR